jgi:hypothetical protein
MMGTKVIKKNVTKVEPSPGSKPGWDTYPSFNSTRKGKVHPAAWREGTKGD